MYLCIKDHNHYDKALGIHRKFISYEFLYNDEKLPWAVWRSACFCVIFEWYDLRMLFCHVSYRNYVKI